MKKWVTIVSIAMLVLVLAACGSSKDKEVDKEAVEQAPPMELEEVEITDEELVPNEEIVLEIEGEEITGEQYNRRYKNTKIIKSANQQLDDLDEVKKDTMDAIIYETILKQDAESKGVEVTDEEFDEEFDFIKDENSEGLELLLEQFQMTEEGFKDELRYNILYQKYAEAEFSDVEVEDEEVESIYNELKENNEDILPLEEVQEDLKEQIKGQKIEELVVERMDKLISEASIVENI